MNQYELLLHSAITSYHSSKYLKYSFHLLVYLFFWSISKLKNSNERKKAFKKVKLLLILLRKLEIDFE